MQGNTNLARKVLNSSKSLLQLHFIALFNHDSFFESFLGFLGFVAAAAGGALALVALLINSLSIPIAGV
jgi:hypothetical protein